MGSRSAPCDPHPAWSSRIPGACLHSEVAKTEESKPPQACCTPLLASRVLTSGWWNPSHRTQRKELQGHRAQGCLQEGEDWAMISLTTSSDPSCPLHRNALMDQMTTCPGVPGRAGFPGIWDFQNLKPRKPQAPRRSCSLLCIVLWGTVSRAAGRGRRAVTIQVRGWFGW